MSRKHAELMIPVGVRDHIQGDPHAAVTLLEYGDYECTHCGRAHPIVKRLLRRLGPKMRFAFRNFPLSEMHPHAVAAAEMAEAAGIQDKFWPLHDMLFEHQCALEPAYLMQYAHALQLDISKLQTSLTQGEAALRVRTDVSSGVESGVSGTPAFFINGAAFEGDWTDENEFAEALEAAAGKH